MYLSLLCHPKVSINSSVIKKNLSYCIKGEKGDLAATECGYDPEIRATACLGLGAAPEKQSSIIEPGRDSTKILAQLNLSYCIGGKKGDLAATECG